MKVYQNQRLSHTASEGEIGIVEYLFNKGAILDVGDPNRNPLFSAIYGGHLDVVKYLVQNGIDITVKYTGDTMKDMELMNLLLKEEK